MLMMQTEVAGGFPNHFEEGRGSSSTMPLKRNPIACELDYRGRPDRAPACWADARCDGGG